MGPHWNTPSPSLVCASFKKLPQSLNRFHTHSSSCPPPETAELGQISPDGSTEIPIEVDASAVWHLERVLSIIKPSFATGSNGLSSFTMVNCPLFGRRKKTTSPPLRSNINGVGTSIPRLLSLSPMNDINTSSPTALQTTLQELLSSAPAELVPVLADLSFLSKRIERTPANIHGLGKLAALLERLRPTVAELLERNTNQGQTFVKDLKQELQSLTEDLEAAWSQGRLDEFFSAAAYTASFEKHSLVLVQIIADSAIVTAREVLESVRETGGRKFFHIDQSSPAIRGQIMSGDVTGGLGGTGGNAHTGGEGGEGQGPQLAMDPNKHYRIGNISGGTGGAGGIGIETGGKGGTGKGPVIISAGRKRRS